MCVTCDEKEMCGVYATTRAIERKKKLDTKELEVKELEKDKTTKEIKAQLTSDDRKQVWNIMRENETYKAMKKRTKRNLFDQRYDYNLNSEAINKESMKWATTEILGQQEC